MWKDYSVSFIKKNRASSVSVAAAAFIAALFLSLLSSLFYNFWNYEVERIILEEGGWHGRITGEIREEDLSVIENFANVEKVQVHATAPPETTVDIYFRNIRAVYREMPLIAERLGLGEEAVSYHELLLSRYLVHDPQDEEPPLLIAFYLAILLAVSLSLILIIHNSFALSMNARIHQFGILSSIGASPGQICTCLMQEAAALCVLPLLAGSIAGTALGAGVVRIINLLAADMAGRHTAVFQFSLPVFTTAILLSGVTVLISAWLPAGKLARLTPLEAIRNTGEPEAETAWNAGKLPHREAWNAGKLPRRKAWNAGKLPRRAAHNAGKPRRSHFRILALLAGIEGELAGNALKARRKALRTSTLSLTLSFLGFTVMLCIFTLSGISTNHTYFERYQDAWDIMITVKNTDIGSIGQAEAVRSLPGVRSCVMYQKAEAVCVIPEAEVSEELDALGGPVAVAGGAVTAADGAYLVKAPLVIMDDAGFEEYCAQTGISPAGGSIVLNRIWDSVNSNFRYKEYVPFVKEEQRTLLLQGAGAVQSAAGYASEGAGQEAAAGDAPEEAVRLSVDGYTQEAPALREEYENYALVQFLPLSVWEKLSGPSGGAQADTYIGMQTDTYIRILAVEGTTPEELDALEAAAVHLLDGYTTESENRIREKQTDDNMRRGSMLILGAFCALLAVIGIANVFSNTLGFVRQRKREFARYMSVGMTPRQIRKMFCVEILVIAGRPLLITLPLTAAVTGFMITASYLDPMEFLAQAPVVPVLVFFLAIFGFVALAYYIGGKRILKCSLADALRDDSIG